MLIVPHSLIHNKYGGDVSLLTKLAVNSPSVNTATVAIKGASGEDGTLILSSAKGINTSVFHNGSGGNIFLRSAHSSGFISLNDTGSRVFIGTSTMYSALFSNTIANGSDFLNFVQFNGDVTLLTRLLINSPVSTINSTCAINGANTTDGTLVLTSAKGAYVCKFHSGATANLELRSGLATGTVFIQDNLGPVVIGASSAQTGF